MTILDRLQSRECWLEFFAYKKAGGHLAAAEEEALWDFIQREAYVPVVERIRRREPFPIPEIHILSKKNSAKKRVVFTCPPAENTVLKLLAYCLQQYDPCMASNLYSFRRHIGARHAVEELIHTKGIDEMYSYKLDIRDYFNSVDVDKLLPRLRRVLQGEEETYLFLQRLLQEPRSLRDGEIVMVKKGIMAGLPVSAFLANVYLMDLDHEMERRGVLYARYSDDIIVFAPTRQQLEQWAARLREVLAENGLLVNPNKCAVTEPGQTWEYLGFSYGQGHVDISQAALEKVMAKCRRKARAIYRWKCKNNKEDLHAVRAYIKYIDQKFFDNPVHNELTWCRWYLPVINTEASLRKLDHYIQQNMRYLMTGRHTKANYKLRYETMQALGYRSLVHAYYEGRKR